MSTIDVHTLSGAYVLHSLDAREAARFAKHVSTCMSCAIEVAELSEAVTRLADETWAIAPARLRTRLMARIRRVRQEAPIVAPQRYWLSRWLSSQWLRVPRPALAAAMAAAILAGTAATVVFGVQARQASSELAAAQASAGAIQAVLTAPDALLRTSTVSGGGTMTVASSAARQQTVIMLAAAHPPAAGSVYQLWTIRNGKPVSVAILHPGQSTITTVAEGAGPGTIIGLTVEPEGGSATPTMPIAAQASAA